MKIAELSLSTTPETLMAYLDDIKVNYPEDFIRMDKEYDNGVVAKFDRVHLRPVSDFALYYSLLQQIEPYIVGNYGKRMRISNMCIHRYSANTDYASLHVDSAYPDSHTMIVPLTTDTHTIIGGVQYIDKYYQAYILEPLTLHEIPAQSKERYSLVVWFKEFVE